MENKFLPKEVKFELLEEMELFGEKLDFSELINVKGGDKPVPPPKPSGSSGGFICWCS